MTSSFDFPAWLAARRNSIDTLLDARLPLPRRDADPGRLIEAMRYSLLAPGKRLRPLLALAAAEAVGAARPPSEPVRLCAAATELVHCYSLIHDDLPCMDNDDFRRGKPSSHKRFGEATAILAGDALSTLAFEWIAEAGRAGGGGGGDFLACTAALARGAGMWGMVRGQARDLGEPAPETIEHLERLHAEKTGALFGAAVEVGGHAAGAGAQEIHALAAYAIHYGVAFQHADDLSDADHPRLAGEAHKRVGALVKNALLALGIFGPSADPLRQLALALARKPDNGIR